MNSVTAFAPASVGNVAVGFDVLGHSVDAVGDAVRLTQTDDDLITVGEIDGIVTDLPARAEDNSAARPLLAMKSELNLPGGVRVDIRKGIPLGSGMGGSAASAVAAVVAADEFWQLGLDQSRLLTYSLLGEATASGVAHADNVAASLFGGLVLCEGGDEPRITRLSVPRSLRCVLVHPDLSVETRAAREVLAKSVSLTDHVRQTQFIAGFVAGCCTGDVEQIARCLRDVIVEPQRSGLVPGFEAVQAAALGAGALGASLSGSGPSVFAWCRESHAEEVARAMSDAFSAQDIDCDSWISLIDAPGARVTGMA